MTAVNRPSCLTCGFVLFAGLLAIPVCTSQADSTDVSDIASIRPFICGNALPYTLKKLRNKSLVDFVTDVGEKVAKSANHHNRYLDFEFVVFEDEFPSAMAFFGRSIYVSSGLLRLLESEAELAAVLGHEIGHCVGVMPTDEPLREIVINDTVFIKVLPEPRDANQYEADSLGIRLMVSAGYDPIAAVTALRRTANFEERVDTSLAVRTEFQERETRIRTLIDALHVEHLDLDLRAGPYRAMMLHLPARVSTELPTPDN